MFGATPVGTLRGCPPGLAGHAASASARVPSSTRPRLGGKGQPRARHGGLRAEVLWVLFAVVLATGPAMGQGEVDARPAAPLELSLEEAVRLALGSSRAAIAARLGRDEQEWAVAAEEERYDLRATIGATAEARSHADETAEIFVGPRIRVPTGGEFALTWREPIGGDGDQSFGAVLSFSQPLLRGFGTDIDTAPLRKARLQDRIAVRSFRDAAADIVGTVISAYRAVLRAQRRVEIGRAALERARGQLATNRKLVEGGRMAPQDLVQTEAEVADREYALVDSENALEEARSTVVNVLDLEDDARPELEPEAAVVAERPELDASLETAFALRTDWLRAEIGMELAQIDLRLAHDDRLWDLSLDAEASRAGTGDGNSWSGALNLTVPLWDGNPRRAVLRARNGVRRAEMALAETRQGIRIEVRRAVQGTAVALRQVDAARQARKLAERKLEIERRKLQEGLSSAFQLGRFENDLVTAENRELDAVVRYRDALTALDRTLGTTLERWGFSVKQVGR